MEIMAANGVGSQGEFVKQSNTADGLKIDFEEENMLRRFIGSPSGKDTGNGY